MRVIIFTFIGVLLMMCGCASYSVDARLEAAEGLMYSHPDSALVLLNHIDPEQLEGESNKAYYALLYTQARHENGCPMEDTSLINSALNYYSKIGDEEKYVRSLIYKAMAIEGENGAESVSLYRIAERSIDTALVVSGDDIEAHRATCLGHVNSVMGGKSLEHKNSQAGFINLLAVSLLLLLAILCVIVAKMVMAARLNRELIERLQTECGESKEILLKMCENESRLKQALNDQIGKIRELIDLSHRFSGSPRAFMDKFKERMQVTSLPDDFWKDLRFFVDANYNNVITRISESYPNLSNDELCVIALMCCGFSYTETSICMGYTNIYSANTKKVRIAKKMNLTEPLKDFVMRMVAD